MDRVLSSSLEATLEIVVYTFETMGGLRAASHYGRPSREAVGLNGQTLSRVQSNGLKIINKIWEFELLGGHSVKPSKAKSKVSKGRRSIPLYSLPKTTLPI